MAKSTGPAALRPAERSAYERELQQASSVYVLQERTEWGSFQPRELNEPEQRLVESALRSLRERLHETTGTIFGRARWQQVLDAFQAKNPFRVLARPPTQTDLVHHFTEEPESLFGVNAKSLEQIDTIMLLLIFAVQAEISLGRFMHALKLNRATFGMATTLYLSVRGPYEVARRFLCIYHAYLLTRAPSAPSADKILADCEAGVAAERADLAKHKLMREQVFYHPRTGEPLTSERIHEILMAD